MMLNLLLLLCFIGLLIFMHAVRKAADVQDGDSEKRKQLMKRVQQLHNRLDGIRD